MNLDRGVGRWVGRGTLALLWLTSLALVWSGRLVGVQWGNEIPAWVLIGLVGLSLVVTVLAMADGAGLLRLLIGVSFGLVVLVPWILVVVRGISFVTPGWAVAALGMVATALFVGSHLTSPALLRASVLIILLAGVWVSICATVAAHLGADIPALYYASDRALLGLPQTRGAFGHPNTMAMFAVVAAVVSLQFTRAVARTRGVGSVVIAGLIGPLPAVLLVVATQSRSGNFTLLVGLVLVLIPARWRWGRLMGGVALALVYVGSLVPLVVAGDSATAFHGRPEAWAIASANFFLDPVVGGGPDAYVNPPPGVSLTWNPGHAHSQLLQSVALSGLVGLVVLLVAAGLAAWVVIRAMPTDDSWGLGVVGSLAAYGWLEPSLGVTAVPITLLAPILAVAVLGSALVMSRVPDVVDRVPAGLVR